MNLSIKNIIIILIVIYLFYHLVCNCGCVNKIEGFDGIISLGPKSIAKPSAVDGCFNTCIDISALNLDPGQHIYSQYPQRHFKRVDNIWYFKYDSEWMIGVSTEELWTYYSDDWHKVDDLVHKDWDEFLRITGIVPDPDIDGLTQDNLKKWPTVLNAIFDQVGIYEIGVENLHDTLEPYDYRIQYSTNKDGHYKFRDGEDFYSDQIEWSLDDNKKDRGVDYNSGNPKLYWLTYQANTAKNVATDQLDTFRRYGRALGF